VLFTSLLQDESVCIVFKKDDYKNHPTWINEVVKGLPVDTWCLVADIDEFFVFPGYEDYPIGIFTGYLESNNFDCVSSILLDVYSKVPISQAKLDYQVSPINILNWFDSETNELRGTKYFGGVRKRVFDVTPLITKYSLFKNKADLVITAGCHDFISNNILYKKTAILHAKYEDRVVEAVRNKNYWNGSIEYVGYLRKLKVDKNLLLWYEGSKKYYNFDSLVNEHILEGDVDIGNTKKCKVSIIICTFGRKSISKNLINSLEKQTFKDFEVIIVNNNKYNILIEFQANLNFKIINERNKGLSNARNTGVYNSSGSHCMFIDDDVILDSECVRLLLQGMEKYNSDIVGGTVLLPQEFENIKSKKVRKYLSELQYQNDIENLQEPKYIVGANMLFKRSVFLKYGPFLNSLGRIGKNLLSGEENEFIFRIQSYGSKVSYVKNAIAYHYIDKDRTIKTYMIRRYFYQGVTDYKLSRLCKGFNPRYKLFENNPYDSMLNLSKFSGFSFQKIKDIMKHTHERYIKNTKS
jgi:GT2 family glycosyltransferase